MVNRRLLSGILSEVRRYPDVKVATDKLNDVLDKLDIYGGERADILEEIYSNEPRLSPQGDVYKITFKWDELNHPYIQLPRSIADEIISNKYDIKVDVSDIFHECYDWKRVATNGVIYIGLGVLDDAIDNKKDVLVTVKTR